MVRLVTAYRFFPILLLFLVGVALTAGCVGKRPPRGAQSAVSGTVSLDGSPVGDATMTFVPSGGGESLETVTSPMGGFNLSSNQLSGKSGTFKVGIVQMKKKFGRNSTETENGLPEKFADPASSGLTLDVGKATEPIQFKLEK